MAEYTYTKHDWQAGEVITESLLDNMEEGIYQANTRAMTPGPKGDKGDTGAAGAKGATGAAGADGKSVKALALTTDASGKVTGGTCTLSDNSTIAVTVTTAGT